MKILTFYFYILTHVSKVNLRVWVLSEAVNYTIKWLAKSEVVNYTVKWLTKKSTQLAIGKNWSGQLHIFVIGKKLVHGSK